MPEVGTHWVATRLTAIRDSTSLRKTEDSHPSRSSRRALLSKQARSSIDSSSKGGEPARIALRCGSGRTRTPRRVCGAHRLPSELRPRRIPLPWSGQGDSNPQPLGSGPSALARLSYTQLLMSRRHPAGPETAPSARWESNPDRTLIRRPGLTEATRGSVGAATPWSRRQWAICESNAVRAPYQRAQGYQPVMARTTAARCLSPPPLRVGYVARRVRTGGFEPPLSRT